MRRHPVPVKPAGARVDNIPKGAPVVRTSIRTGNLSALQAWGGRPRTVPVAPGTATQRRIGRALGLRSGSHHDGVELGVIGGAQMKMVPPVV
jgi:hypothetical protein